MSSVVCPIPNKSGLAVTPLKSTPEVALPPSVNGTAIIWVTTLTVLERRDVDIGVGDVEVAGGEGQAGRFVEPGDEGADHACGRHLAHGVVGLVVT